MCALINVYFYSKCTYKYQFAYNVLLFPSPFLNVSLVCIGANRRMQVRTADFTTRCQLNSRRMHTHKHTQPQAHSCDEIVM